MNPIITENNFCRHVHITDRTKTTGTNYVKGWCSECKAWVYTEKKFCLCCMKAVKHTTHHIHIKQILNNAMDIHKEAIDQFKFMPFKEMIYVESVFKDRRYHIPLKYLSLWSEHPHPNEILSLIQDVITIVKK